MPPFPVGVGVRAIGHRTRHFEEGVRQQTEGDMAVPAIPLAHLVLVQPHLTLAHSKPSSMTQRVPATRAISAIVVVAGAKPR